MLIVEMMYDPRSSGIQSSPKEMQLPKTCVSFGEESFYLRKIDVWIDTSGLLYLIVICWTVFSQWTNMTLYET